jgi:hypothetical protein
MCKFTQATGREQGHCKDTLVLLVTICSWPITFNLNFEAGGPDSLQKLKSDSLSHVTQVREASPLSRRRVRT